MSVIEGYASTTSACPGETVTFHVRTIFPSAFRLKILRKGKTDQVVHTDWGFAFPHSIPTNAYEVGCGWPSACAWTIPQTLKSGCYFARLTGAFPIPGATTEIPFVVKAAAPGTTSKILIQLTVSTCEAYNPWGGRSLYGHFDNDRYLDDYDDFRWFDPRACSVSFDRPGALKSFHSFLAYEYPFIQWLEANGCEVEYCTSIDLHAHSDFLTKYQLLLSVGHDEYWSWEMRDQVEAFIARGGNVAFFSGNTCWWQVRFENNNRVMVCYRDAASDPVIDRRRTTVNWRKPPVNRPEETLTGVSFANGAWWNQGVRPVVGYVVRFAQHWVFEGTGLGNGATFGTDQSPSIVGYETDAALLVPQVAGDAGTPLNFIVLALADLSDWAQTSGGTSGKATMGIYRRNGVVFNAATTDWFRGLLGPWNAVQQITLNVLRRLSSRVPARGASPWLPQRLAPWGGS